jgi:prephenate dehydrogenase
MKKLSIIGLGLIGSSVARGLKGKYHITGYNRNFEVATKAQKEGVIDVAAASLADAVQTADIVLIATPMRYYEQISGGIAEHLPVGAIVTDVGSVKTPAIMTIYKHMPPGVEFVPAHPIAGKETSGFASGDGLLFKGKKVIITPLPKNSVKAITEVENLWKSLGAMTEQLTAAEHDKIYAAVSHAPQLLAYAYAMALRHKKFAYAGKFENEFKTYMRISKSDPNIWVDIFQLNRAYIFKFLEKIFGGLNHLEHFVDQTELRSRLAGAVFKPKFTGDKKTDAASIVFPALLGNLLLFCVDDELENNVSRSFSMADISESLGLLEQQIKPIEGKDFASYAGSGLRDFTTFSLLDVSEYVEEYAEEINLLKALLHRKMFEVTAAIESDSAEHLLSKLNEALG